MLNISVPVLVVHLITNRAFLNNLMLVLSSDLFDVVADMLMQVYVANIKYIVASGLQVLCCIMNDI